MSSGLVEITGGYRTIIIYGSETPIGSRIAHYLEKYADAIGYELNIVLGESPYKMLRVQREIWEIYVGKGGTSRPDLIINAHVFDDVEYAETDVIHCFARNMQTAAILALAAKAAEIPMIQISTDHVFKGNRGPYTVAQRRHPLNIFGLSMKLAEDVIHGFLPGSYSIIRVSQVYGSGVEYKPASYVGRASYAFIGDIAFLIARNLISSPYSLRAEQGIIHCGPSGEPFDWGDDGQPDPVQLEYPVTIGTERGLVPSPGWVLPPHASGLEKARKEESLSGFMAYWELSVSSYR